MAIHSPVEVTDNYIKASAAKAKSPAWRLFVLAFFAGILVSLGAIASSTAAQGIAGRWDGDIWDIECHEQDLPAQFSGKIPSAFWGRVLS